MEESICPSMPAPATLPSSAASTPTAAESGYFALAPAPCDGPISHRASAGTQRNSVDSDAPRPPLAASRLRVQSVVDQAPVAVLAAPPQQQPRVTPVLPEHTGSWHPSIAQPQVATVSGGPFNIAASVINGLWSPQQLSTPSSGDTWAHGEQQYSAAGPQHRGHPGVQPAPAAPHAAQQTYTWQQQQQQLNSPTWQQQQQGWYYNRTNNDINSSGRPRSHSPRSRRRQHQLRARPHSSNAGASTQPQQWQQPPPAASYQQQQHDGLPLQLQQPQTLGQQPRYYQLQQSIAAVNSWQAMPPPPTHPSRWQQWPQQQPAWGSSNSSSDRWQSTPIADAGSMPPAGNSSSLPPGAAVAGTSFHNTAVAGLMVPAAAAAVASDAAMSAWHGAIAPQQHQQQQADVHSHQLSHVETDSDEAEEWFSVTHSPLPHDAQQQQQRVGQAGSSSRWRPPTPYSPSDAPAVADRHGPATAVGAGSQQAPLAGHVGLIDVQPHVHSAAGGSIDVAPDMGSAFADISSDDDYEEAMPELISDVAAAGVGLGSSGTSDSSNAVHAQTSTAAAAAWGFAVPRQPQPGMVGPEVPLGEGPLPAAAGNQAYRAALPPAQWRRHRLGSIDELQPDPWRQDATAEPSVAAAVAAARGEDVMAAAAGVGEHPEWLMRFLDDAAQQQQQRWQLSRRRSTAAAAWRSAELSRLTEEAAALMAVGAAADDDGDSTAATAAGSSVDGYPSAAATAVPAAVAGELPQLARLRTAAVPARSGAALDDSPNAQIVHLMQQLQQRYEAVQQEQLNIAQQVWQQHEFQQQQQQQREYVLRRYGVLAPAGGPVNNASNGYNAVTSQDLAAAGDGSGSSNPTAAGAPYRPLQAAAATGAPGSSSGAVGNSQQAAAAADTALLQQLLESATRSTQEVDASAMAAIAGSWQQWQQQRAPQGQGASAQPNPNHRLLDPAESSPNVTAGGVASSNGRVSDMGSVMRASFESSSWQDGMPPLLDAEDDQGFDGLTPNISPPQSSVAVYPSSSTTVNPGAGPISGVNPSPNPGQHGFVSTGFGIGSPPFVGWDATGYTSMLLSPRSRDLAAVAAAEAAAAGMGGPSIQQQQQQQQQRLMMPPPPPLVRGRWSSSSSIPSPLMSPAVLMPAAAGQAAAMRTPQASGISDQDFVTPQAAVIMPQQQPPQLRPPRLQQQQQWPPSPAAGWAGAALGGALPSIIEMQGMYGPYTADNSPAAVAAAAGQVQGNLPGPVFSSGMAGFSGGSWQQQQQGMAAVADASRAGRVPGRRQYVQGMVNPAANNVMLNRQRSPAFAAAIEQQAAAANIAAAGAAASAAAAAAAGMGGQMRVSDPAGGYAAAQQQWQQQRQQQQWQRDLLAMQLGQPLSLNQLPPTMANPAAAAASAAATAARRRQAELQQQMLAARGGLVGRGRSRVLGAGGLGGAGPDVMLRMMRMMGLEEPLEFEFARMFGAGDGMSYEQLIGLEDVRVVVPSHVLAQLPRRSVPQPVKTAATAAADGASAEAESVICTICQCDLAGSELVVQLPCKHDYHESCVCEWLSKYKKTCPVCKAEVK